MDKITRTDKSLVQSHRQCPRRAWLEFHGTVEPVYTMAERAMLDQGKSVHAAGRSLFAGLEMVASTVGMEEAARQTAKLVASSAQSIAEAAFVSGSLGVRVDVLERGRRSFRIVEIKTGGEAKDEYLDDCAIQYACVTGAGVEVEAVELMHPSTQRVRPSGGTGGEVLVREDVTDSVHWRSMMVPMWVNACLQTINGDEPQEKPGQQCSDPNPCPFSGYCGKPVVNTDPDRIELLPSQAGKKLKAQIAAGVNRISDLPMEALEHKRNALVHAAVVLNRTVIGRDFAEMLAGLPYPRTFVDFEAAAFPIPLWAGVRAHQAIPFQWSAHRQESERAEYTHTEFLDTTGNDPRRGFVESLLEVVGSEGPVLVFSHYEKTRLKELALLFADLRDGIMALIGRLVDLLPPARLSYYHPSMLGSWSLKKIVPTLPAVAGDLTYSDLDDVAEGMAAQAAYMLMIDPSVIGPEKEHTREAMLLYCKLDTGGLIRFVDYVQGSLKANATRFEVDGDQAEHIEDVALAA